MSFLAPLLVESLFLNERPQVGGLILVAILVGLTIVPLVGAINPLTLQLSDQQGGGIVSLFVMTFSFRGMTVLAAQGWEYLLAFWRFAIAAIIWIPLAGWESKPQETVLRKSIRKQNRPHVLRLEHSSSRKIWVPSCRLLSMLLSCGASRTLYTQEMYIAELDRSCLRRLIPPHPLWRKSWRRCPRRITRSTST